MDNNNTEKKINSIKNLFAKLFFKKGYEIYDYFDRNVWFIKNRCWDENVNFFREIFSLDTSENDDIIKFMISKSFIHSNMMQDFKIKVEDFIDDIAEVLFKLHEDNKRVDNLIKLYDAYKTKNLIEQVLENQEKLFRNLDIFKSTMKISIDEISIIPKGDYKISILSSFIDDKLNISEDDTDVSLKEEILEYKLKSIIRVEENKILKSENLNENIFPAIEFYAYDLKSKTHKLDSGTNMLSMQLKLENLANPISKELDVILSDKKTAIELFLSNRDILLNNTNRNKNFVTEFNLKDINNFECKIKLRFSLELDPWTLRSILIKIYSLLQTTISYKVLNDHKLNTILYYFEEISDSINNVFNEDLNNKKGKCIVF